MSDESGATPTPTTPATGNVPAAQAAPQGATPTTPTVTPDTAARIQELETSLASAEARIKELNSENKKYRLLSDTLTAQGLKPEDVKGALEAGKAAADQLSARDKADTMRTACEAAGLDYSDFSTRKGVDDWAYEVKDENKDGKTVKVPYVTFKDDEGKDVSKPLAEHATATFPTIAKAGSTQQVVTVPVMGVSNGNPTPSTPSKPAAYSM